MASEQVTAYFKELKLTPAKDRADVNARLEKAAGRKEASALRAALEAGRIHADEFTETACAQVRRAVEVASVSDYEYLRSACEYILQYSAGFGARILDAGCGNGILTCFIAKVYPNSRVIGIDRNAAAIRCAQQLAQRLELRNVEFKQITLSQLEDEPFNTVFCARMLKENLLPAPMDADKYWYDILAAETVEQERVHALAVALASKMAPESCLVCFEDVPKDPQFYAYLTTLNELEVGVIPQTCVQWTCESPLDYTDVQAFIACRGSRLDHENLYWIWATLLARGVDMNGASYDGYIGDIFIRRVRGKLLRGMNMYDDAGKIVRKMLLWSSNREQDAGTIYLQQLNLAEQTRLVECYAVEARGIVDGYYDRCEKAWRERGRKITRFSMNDQYEETEEE